MTDTDLITASDRTPQTESSATVKSESPTADSAPDAASGSSLNAMVLPELRALAASAGVKGASGMRKGDLISAIREVRGTESGRNRTTETNQRTDAEPADRAPERNQSDSGQSGSSQSDSGQSDSGQSDSGQSDSGQSDSGQRRAVIVPAAAVAMPAVPTRPNFGRTKSFNRWREFLTFSTTTPLCAPPAILPGPTTSTSR